MSASLGSLSSFHLVRLPWICSCCLSLSVNSCSIAVIVVDDSPFAPNPPSVHLPPCPPQKPHPRRPNRLTNPTPTPLTPATAHDPNPAGLAAERASNPNKSKVSSRKSRNKPSNPSKSRTMKLKPAPCNPSTTSVPTKPPWTVP